MQYWGIRTIVFLLPYLILACILHTLSVPLIVAIGIRVLAFIGCKAIADVRGTMIGCYNTFDPVTFIFIGGLLGAPVFVGLTALGIEAVAISALGVAALSWFAVLLSVFLQELAVFYLLIAVFISMPPALIAFAAVWALANNLAIAVLGAVIVSIVVIGLLCRWVCGEEIWSSPDCRELAGHAAWGSVGAWTVFCAWTLTFSEIPPDGLHNAGLLALAVVLAAATIKLMLSEVILICFPFGLLSLVELVLTVSLIDVGLGWLIRSHFA